MSVKDSYHPGPDSVQHRLYQLGGACMWLCCVQYFFSQVFVSAAWAAPYSLRDNVISDLGNTGCATQGVCSPLHSVFNVSLILLGVLMAVGAGLLLYNRRRTPVEAAGFGLIALAGIGAVLAGVFPENGDAAVHSIGAGTALVTGNLALLIFAATSSIPAALRWCALGFGLAALGALALFALGNYGLLGKGGMERLAAYPQTIWIIAYGAYLLRRQIFAAHP